jgi:uncharacterized membrane protein YdjX (TVP38/TMEM64 family)
LLSSRRQRKLLVGIGLLLLGAIVVLWFRDHLTVEQLIGHEQQLRRAIEEHPLIGALVGFLVFSTISFIPGLSGKALIVGWLYGLLIGVLIVNLGLTLVALVEFWLARHLLRDVVQSRFGFYLIRMNEALEAEGAFYVFAIRMMHFPYTISNYVLGATSVRTWSYLWATQLGLLPSNLIFVFVGSRFPNLRVLTEEGPWSLVTTEIAIALVMLGIVPLLLRKGIAAWHQSNLARYVTGKSSES